VDNVQWLGHRYGKVWSGHEVWPVFSGWDTVKEGYGQAVRCGQCSVSGTPLWDCVVLLVAEGSWSRVFCCGGYVGV
jgi:hypothetical protein